MFWESFFENPTGFAFVKMGTERNFFMGGDQAKEYGIIDKVISKRDLKAVS